MRSAEALNRHFAVERELADRLKNAPREDRKRLYRELYDELFRRVPDHPQHDLKRRGKDQQAKTNAQLQLIRPLLGLDDVFLEVGSGDCLLARQVADLVREVYAVDVSEIITAGKDWPTNLKLILSDGISIEVPPGSAHLAYSNQLMEHLHPDDAVEQLTEIYRALAPGGIYVCVTPHRFSGPHDISKHFCKSPQGFHLKEYSCRDLVNLFRQVGFVQVDFWSGFRGTFLQTPSWAVLSLEAVLSLMPQRLRRQLTGAFPLRSCFGNATIMGHKAH